ncbi:MAG: DUF2723 domain-containing protein, partial [Bacteroidia bacterium]|nr:DUF2723 domain-containing protein [Bacteroidia bacterium]
MNNYRLINNIVGWAVFLIAAIVYITTVEPTGSFWDCGEFIAAAYKLQVGHPPGAPFFMLIGRFFTLFAPDVTQVAIMVNYMSALASAFTILFLFWTITALAKKFIVKEEGSLTTSGLVGIMGAGAVGALAGTFCDSFWFSAVEGEVYATSSFFTALVVWAMLKWESVADEKHNLRWIIFIAFMMGLSIGVHLLNLLTIPALAFIYYFKKYPVTRKGIIWTSIAAVVILGVVQFGVIAGLVNIASRFELLFVNSFGLPFWSGFFFFMILVAGAIAYGLKYSSDNGKPILNTALLCFAFLLIGYSTYGTIVIRSIANPPMDENNPEHPFSLLSYLNREQYGDRPLLFGQHYNADVIKQEKGSWQYAKGEDNYEKTTQKIIPVYEKEKNTFLPRMYSAQANHVKAYKQWAGVEGDATPTFGQNMKFMFSYQLGWMYWRYFFWNFVGRQNDIQGHGEITHGNWLSGIDGLDAMRLGPKEKLPESMDRNKGRNHFYFLPLLLGLIGLLYHFVKSSKDFWVVA